MKISWSPTKRELHFIDHYQNFHHSFKHCSKKTVYVCRITSLLILKLHTFSKIQINIKEDLKKEGKFKSLDTFI